jgi:hypothetical protein
MAKLITTECCVRCHVKGLCVQAELELSAPALAGSKIVVCCLTYRELRNKGYA